MTNAKLDHGALAWVIERVGHGADPIEVQGLRFGDSPWLIRFSTGDVVLRVSDDAGAIETERAALELAASHGLPVPRVLGSRLTADAALLLTERVAGDSSIPFERPDDRLRRLGAFAAGLSAIFTPPSFAPRAAPINGVDFAELRRESEPREILRRAESAVAAYVPGGPDGFVHGDLWHGNTLWDEDRLVGVIDWDCAGTGKAGLDLGSLRLDAVLDFGEGADELVLDGWESAAGAEALDASYWDLVAGLSTPPDMGWFVEVTRAQGRPDLTRELMITRRDDFLSRALGRL